MAVTITQRANPAGVSASSNVSTYSSVSIGEVTPNRIVVVLVATELSSSTPSGCTIDYGSGDTAMTAGTGGNFGAVYAQTYRLLVPTGTTATIKVTYSSTNPTNVQNHIAVYTVTDAVYASAGGDGSTDMDSTDPLTTGSTTIASGGGFIAVAAGATDTVAKTWANATKDLDVDAGGFRFTTATYTTAGTATRTCTGGTNGEDGAMSWLFFTNNASPTTALNTPANGGGVSDTTPTLNFTGTDTESEELEYEVQIDTGSGFGSSLGSVNYPSSGAAWKFAVYGTGMNIDIGSAASDYSSTFASGYTIIDTSNAANASGTLNTIEIWANSTLSGCKVGTFYGTAPNLTNRDMAVIGSVTSGSKQTFTNLAIDVQAGDFIGIYFTSGLLDYQGAATNTMYYVTGDKFNTPPLIQAISEAGDAGFANPDNGGDGHPWASGTDIDYTVQSAQADNTYYWRSRSKDRAGSNEYGSWPTARTYVLTAGTSVSTEGATQTVTVSLQSPTVTTERSVSTEGGVQTATASIQAPTITTVRNVSTEGASQTATWSIISPTVTAEVSTSTEGATQTATLTIQFPTISTTWSVNTTADVQTSSWSLQAPTITTVASVEVQPAEVLSTWSLQAPTITAEISVSTEAGVQIITGSLIAPSISTGVGVSAEVISGTVSTISPTISTVRNVEVLPSEVLATSSIQAPTITAVQNIEVLANTVATIGSLLAPDVSTQIFVEVMAGIQQLTASLQAPSVGSGVAVNGDLQTITVTIQSPSISTQQSISFEAGVNQATITIPTPTIDTVANVNAQPTEVTITATLNNPTVIGQRHIEVMPSVQDITTTLLDPEITAIQEHTNVTITAPVLTMMMAIQQAVFVSWRRKQNFTQRDDNHYGITTANSGEREPNYHGRNPLYKNN